MKLHIHNINFKLVARLFSNIYCLFEEKTTFVILYLIIWNSKKIFLFIFFVYFIFMFYISIFTLKN
jgi:hypothetical protein